MTSEERSKRYALFTGRRQRPPSTVKRTENSLTYEIPVNIDKRFGGWAAMQRTWQREYSFEQFYNEVLSDGERSKIVVISLIEKNNTIQ